MTPIETRLLGRTDISLSALGFGSTRLGNLYLPITERDALDTVQSARALGLRYFDCAPLYGHGLAESRLGTGLRLAGRGDAVISTKVGWLPRPAFGKASEAGHFAGIRAFRRDENFSYDGVMRSFEDSMHRLGTDSIDILLLHDVDRRHHGDRYDEVFKAAMDGAYKALDFLRAQKLVRAIGCGLNESEACEAFAHAGDFDCFLLAGRYTLLEQTAQESFLPLCRSRSIGVIIGGPFNSGILAGGGRGEVFFDYRSAPPAVVAKCAAIDVVCRRHGVPLKAAALQFPLHDPCVASVIPGVGSVAEVEENVRMMSHPVPADCWRELKHAGLLNSDAPTP